MDVQDRIRTEAQKLDQEWKTLDRWTNIRRDYTAADVIRLRGSFPLGHSYARMASDRLNGDGLSGQRKGHVDRTFGGIGDTVSAMTKANNIEVLSHARPPAGIRHCRRHLEWARE